MTSTKALENVHNAFSGILKDLKLVCSPKVYWLENWTEQYSYFPAFGQNPKSVHMRENTDKILSINGEIQIRESLHFGIFYAFNFPWRTFWIGLVGLVSKKPSFMSYIIYTRSKINLRIPEPILKSKGICAIFQKKGKKVENLGKNDQNLKIFWKRAASCVRLLHTWSS